MGIKERSLETATFAAGCFWGVEAAFRKVTGVMDTRVGYCGGHVPEASYEQVCTGATGHAESVEVRFEPAMVSYEALLDVFWGCHDPTQLNRQGPDIGSQYRSVIFYHNEEQKEIAIASRDAHQQHLSATVVTEIVAISPFSSAEEYHQHYLEKQGLI